MMRKAFSTAFRRILRPYHDRWDMTFVVSVDEAFPDVGDTKPQFDMVPSIADRRNNVA